MLLRWHLSCITQDLPASWFYCSRRTCSHPEELILLNHQLMPPMSEFENTSHCWDSCEIKSTSLISLKIQRKHLWNKHSYIIEGVGFRGHEMAHLRSIEALPAGYFFLHLQKAGKRQSLELHLLWLFVRIAVRILRSFVWKALLYVTACQYVPEQAGFHFSYMFYGSGIKSLGESQHSQLLNIDPSQQWRHK